MYARLDELSEQHLDGLVKQALGKDWQERTGKVLKEALDDLAYQLDAYIGGQLKHNLADQIESEARRCAESFLEALAAGQEDQVRQFLSLPNDYWPQREHWSWRDYGREHNALEFRRRLIMAVQDRLEREVLLDQEAQIKTLVEQIQRQEAELRRWRTGDLERSHA